MRRLSLLTCVGALALAGAALAQSSPELTRKPGWWRIDVDVAGPTPQHQTLQICTTPAVDRVQPPFGVHSGSGCPPVRTTRAGDGWDIAFSCDTGSMVMSADGHASGDLQSAYRVDVTTRMSPPPTPGTAQVKVHMDARWMGPCPQGKAPGDVEMNFNLPPGAPPAR